MARTEIRGGDQILNYTLLREDLVLDFLGGSDWNLTNSNNNATIVGLANAVELTSPATLAQLNAVESKIDTALVIRGALSAPADLTGTSTGNAYIDAGNGFSVGDKFFIDASGNLTVSDGTVAVNAGDSITILADVSGAAITVADIFITDNTESPDIIRTGDVVDNLTTQDGSVPLSANQGFVLKGLIDALDAQVNLRIYSENKAVTHNSAVLPALSNTPVAGTERVYLNGMRMERGAGNDYTIAGSVITFEYNLKTNDKVLVDYEA